MADLFNRDTAAHGGSFSADSATLNFAPFIDSGVGLLVQNVAVQYNRQVTRLFEIGSPQQYYVDGRSEGMASFGRVIGPVAIARVFYTQFGDICNAGQNVIKLGMTNGCRPGEIKGSTDLTLHHCVITSFGVTTNAQSVLINEQLQFMFSYLELNGSDEQA